ncbi:DUF4231 domain-containing protein [Sphingomonas sp. RRHST34]|uniref:DUF4231 domain-containing protein n=1 Tax=Sphingomonas citri TaxID=2862499 RepID=A0ABS7BLN1_9SPHN|nr:DUF4231 domain-containing protein [Sphingomonas citri]MBW6530522.1 DUF4231 domain-containing protein [Sphingomonas citri]
MADTEFDRDFLAAVGRDQHKMKKLADRSMVLFILLRLGLVVGSASLPALSAFAERSWSTVFAIAVAVLAGLDTQFRWGEEWRHFRSAEMTLGRLRQDYDHGIASLKAGRAASELKSPADVFERFYEDVVKFQQSEADNFFKFRIVEWKRNA